jgi:hypothetical protein
MLTNVNDCRAGPYALPDQSGEVFAYSAYRGKIPRGHEPKGKFATRRRNRHVEPE